MLRIARIYYPVKVLGPGNRIGIWTAGCNKNCRGCISPELRNPNYGVEMSTNDILKILKKVDSKVEGITISGGEPFLFPKDLLELVIELEKITNDIIVFTGYDYKELLKQNDTSKVLQHISVLIDGVFDETKVSKYGLKGSDNQQIIILRDSERYLDLETCDHAIQNVLFNNRILSIGIPSGGKI